MVSISLCMIVKNEEDVLERCLKSAAGLADEIIIVDTGSTDRTKEIARSFTDRVFDFSWRDDFSAARNFAFSRGSGDYLMWLDADDVIPEEERDKFLGMKERMEEGKPDVVMMKYAIAFDEGERSTFSYYRERLIRRCPQAVWQGRVHEVIAPFGVIWREDIRVEHRKLKSSDPGRNLRIYEQMIGEGVRLSAREQYYYGKEQYYHKRYHEAIESLEHFLGEPDAWLEDRLDACRHIAICRARLGDRRGELAALLRGMEFGAPRAELCCDIGHWFLEAERYSDAIFWYQSAMRAGKKKDGNGFVLEDASGYVPCLQLCVCFDKLGQYGTAKRYNELAERWKPGSEACRYNRKYFEGRKGP